MRKSLLKRVLFCFVVFILTNASRANEGNSAPSKQYFELRIYHASDTQQVGMLERFIRYAFLPALHRAGIERVGVFKSVENDTAADKRIFILIPHKSLERFEKLQQQLDKDKTLMAAGEEYINTPYNKPSFKRFETIILRAFDQAPELTIPQLTGPKSERIYELRSYEGPTEKFYRNKVQMFNQGGEVTLFKSLGFNAVFYAEVLAGSKMPNLMYMTTFENKAARDEHWKTFSNDPVWKQLSGSPEYQHNVSKADIMFLTPLEFSDF